MRAIGILLAGLIWMGGAKPTRAQESTAPAPTPEQAEFFEKRVRPVLADNCFPCHSGRAQMAGLRLDSRSALLRGASGRPVLVPGDPERSALVRAVRYTGGVKMPPQGKLPTKDIQALIEWTKMGAPWPVGKVNAGNEAWAIEAARKHWAFQPVTRPAIPDVKDAAWVTNPIDAFVLAKLEGQGMTPARPADRRTLLRRVTIDLTGLPPTPDEMTAFEADTSPNAYEKVVDRLLAGPRYGERWGRHWLDVARYADTKGLAFAFGEDRYPFAYTYRDWVIRAFNEDLPYDQFLTQQIAADRLPPREDTRSLAALGFLTLGRRSANGDPDVMDDRIDVVMRGTQGLTVTCARCHDHKFDPIPTKDYYSLYGVFAANIEKTEPLKRGPEDAAAFVAFEKEKAAREAKVAQFLKAKKAELRTQARDRIADYMNAAQTDIKFPNLIQIDANSVSGLKPEIVAAWKERLKAAGKSFDPLFAPFVAFATLPDDKFTVLAPALARKFAANADRRLNPLVASAFDGPAPADLREVEARYARLFKQADGRRLQTSGKKPLNSSEDALAKTYRALIAVIDEREDGGIVALLKPEDQAKLTSLQRRITQWYGSPAAPPHALTLEDVPNAENPHVFVRGNAETPGDEVPRRFLLAIAGENRPVFGKGSGRLELAQAIASPTNPLTARVLVNRVWLYHFGNGIVRTPSDFGLRGEFPTHPELLDWLASQFMADGWSVKKLHRTILLSNAYQMSDEDNGDYRQRDADNRLLWRQNRQRLDFEAMRDGLLAAGGELDETRGGHSQELTRAPFSRRRTVYGVVDRENLPGMYRIFDFAGPEAHSPQRFVTTAPLQSLFLLNSPFVLEQARKLSARLASSPSTSAEQRIAGLYQAIYGRSPSAREIEIGRRFVQTAIARKVEEQEPYVSPWQYGVGEYDAMAKRVKNFKPLAVWTGEMWQGGTMLPDAELGSLSLTASGGSPGSDPQHTAIRRWIAPQDGIISIRATLQHPSMEGDGVRARIVSSRTGLIGEWRAHYEVKDTAAQNIVVKTGDTIDFVVDGLNDDLSDNFLWSPTITLASGDAPAPKGGKKPRFRQAALHWSAQDGYSGPPEDAIQPLTPWEKYAHVC